MQKIMIETQNGLMTVVEKENGSVEVHCDKGVVDHLKITSIKDGIPGVWGPDISMDVREQFNSLKQNALNNISSVFQI